jgi:hypothetical protein
MFFYNKYVSGCASVANLAVTEKHEVLNCNDHHQPARMSSQPGFPLHHLGHI